MGNCADKNGPALLDIMHRLVLNSTVINNTYSFGFQLKKIQKQKKCISGLSYFLHSNSLVSNTTELYHNGCYMYCYDLRVSTPRQALSSMSTLLSWFLQVSYLLCKVIFVYCNLIISCQP